MVFCTKRELVIGSIHDGETLNQALLRLHISQREGLISLEKEEAWARHKRERDRLLIECGSFADQITEKCRR